MISPEILPGATMHGWDTSKEYVSSFEKIQWDCLIIHSAEREREAEKIENEGVTCDKSLMLNSNPGSYGNTESSLANRTTRIQLFNSYDTLKESHCSHIAWYNSTTQCVWKESNDVCILHVARAKIITSQRTGRHIKRPFLSPQWSFWLVITTVTLKPPRS